jgi:SpoVK/Ycf46/Vps4 family AAA+-type ATPase
MSVPEKDQQSPMAGRLASQVKPPVTWSDVAVPAEELQVLHRIAAHVGQPQEAYKSSQSLSASGWASGVVALFAGQDSANKAMAAEALAQHTNRVLHWVNLNEVVSKYIGETEKNLQRIFAAAEANNTILFFDEADALFGKRSEVKDSQDRCANIEVDFLLQQLEAFHGLAVLATNNEERVDPTLRERFAYIVRFPQGPGK